MGERISRVSRWLNALLGQAIRYVVTSQKVDRPQPVLVWHSCSIRLGTRSETLPCIKRPSAQKFFRRFDASLRGAAWDSLHSDAPHFGHRVPVAATGAHIPFLRESAALLQAVPSQAPPSDASFHPANPSIFQSLNDLSRKCSRNWCRSRCIMTRAAPSLTPRSAATEL